MPSIIYLNYIVKWSSWIYIKVELWWVCLYMYWIVCMTCRLVKWKGSESISVSWASLVEVDDLRNICCSFCRLWHSHRKALPMLGSSCPSASFPPDHQPCGTLCQTHFLPEVLVFLRGCSEPGLGFQQTMCPLKSLTASAQWSLSLTSLFSFLLGVDQALPQERRAPVTPSSASRYHRRRSSGSRDERYRSGKAMNVDGMLVLPQKEQVCVPGSCVRWKPLSCPQVTASHLSTWMDS